MATLEDIAVALDITKGTVSKALNGASDVSETMRQSVLEKAVELGYTKTSRKKDKRVCIFVENMTWETPGDFGYDIVLGFRKMAEPVGYNVDIIHLDTNLQNSMSYDAYMLLKGYLGALFLGLSYSDPWSGTLEHAHTPLVILDGFVKSNPKATMIGIDNEEGLDMAVSHLHSQGHRKIGYLSAALGSYVFQQRYLAFFHALRQKNLPRDNDLAKHSYYLSQTIGTNLPSLIKAGCTAIICSHDQIAYAALTYCQEQAIRVPEDLSIVGFDDLPQSSHTYPPLTTVRQNRSELGKSAFYALSCQFSHIPISKLTLHAELIVRQSSAEPKK